MTYFLFIKLLGKVGIAINVEWKQPKDVDNADHVAAAERALQIRTGWFCNPIFGNGDYPDIMKTQLARAGETFGLERSPMHEFSEEEKRYNQGIFIQAMSTW